MTDFIAHRNPLSRDTHGLWEHSTETGRLAQCFAAAWGAGDIAYLAGLWHDLGKYAAEFQEMIGGDPDAHLEGQPAPRKRVNHSSAGALWAMQRALEAKQRGLGMILGYVIAGHHAGLPDWDPTEGGGGLKDRLTQTSHLERALAAKPPRDLLDFPFPELTLGAGKDLSLWIRLLASALFDADFLDTEAFFNRQKSKDRRGWADLATLSQKLDDHLATFEGVTGDVNKVRGEVQAACRKAADLPPGLFSLTVPTGGGKTLSSLAFALDHAQRHGLRRVIYAVPFTSIIEQTADVFRAALGGDAVLEHHSALDPDGNTSRSRLASENWDAPLIVTTTVQLFDSLFAARTSKVRKLHNIAGSVLILDEAQALPPAVLRPVTIVLDQLVKFYGVTVVLCTATQPALRSVFKELGEAREIAPDPPRLFEALKRVTVTWLSDRTPWDQLAARMATEPRALAIVNTRREARALVDLLPDGAVHLSTWQCPAHRQTLLETVRTPDAPVRVVSTSLIEAGVDIDFPVVFRAWTGLDSLAQAAGRCNREGKLDKGQFVVFRPEGAPPRGHILQAVTALETVRGTYGENCFTPQAFRDYFEALYWAKGDTLDKYGMGRLLNLGGAKLQPHLAFRTAAQAFQMIEDGQQAVIVPFDECAERLIDELRRVGPSRDLLRKLQRYTVPLTRWDFDALSKLGVTETLDGLPVLTDQSLYHPDLGLDVPGLSEPRLNILNI
ncbi:CRISPR-associated endonuclease Cas3'' [Magnetospira sp. QH-2]|uniref:CRISPR-associated endonuclease Cas3'' n=1 Tax=Magnetospira sp. (strain QH-2) TaxID=1288970 RepID=UPI0003E81BD8|nr:CRISPR-associated endonuclease Cas3'' [Magnetospira sp. QH-2]CCQ74032.1 CRISPR-associated helicase Cas3 [Magnetospira sp. QH-2]